MSKQNKQTNSLSRQRESKIEASNKANEPYIDGPVMDISYEVHDEACEMEYFGESHNDFLIRLMKFYRENHKDSK